jgi:hypothetical protein
VVKTAIGAVQPGDQAAAHLPEFWPVCWVGEKEEQAVLGSASWRSEHGFYHAHADIEAFTHFTNYVAHDMITPYR